MEMIEQLLITYLANTLWMTCLVAALAMLLAKLIRNGSSMYRHVLWVIALAFASLLPLTSLRLTPSIDSDAATLSTYDTHASSLSNSGTDKPSQDVHWLKMRPRQRPIAFAPLLTEILAASYLGFVLCRVLSLCWAWRRTQRILRGAIPRPLSSRHAAIVERCFSMLDAGKVFVAFSRELRGPVVVGAYRPAMIFPESFFSNVSDEDLTSALCHELVHVRRCDFLFNLLYEVLLLPISFHPAALFIKAQIERSRELACDEIAAKTLPTRAAYARSLLAIAQSLAKTPTSARSGYALGLFDANTLEERVMNLLNKTSRASQTSSRARALVACCLLAAACLITSAFSLQVAGSHSTPAELKQFAGTWEGNFKGKRFITLRLTEKDGKISGSVSRISIHVDPKGELTDASSLKGEDAVAETEPDGKVLHLNTNVKGRVSTPQADAEESVQYDMKLDGEDQAELQIAATPADMPAPAPWKLARKPDTP